MSCTITIQSLCGLRIPEGGAGGEEEREDNLTFKKMFSVIPRLKNITVAVGKKKEIILKCLQTCVTERVGKSAN